jgi:hypothetical protein
MSTNPSAPALVVILAINISVREGDIREDREQDPSQTKYEKNAPNPRRCQCAREDPVG